MQLLSRLLVCFWLGAFLAVGVLVAPAIFDTASTSAQAGVIAGVVFDRLNVAGIGFAFLIISLQRPFFGSVTCLTSSVIILILLSQLWITPQIELLRAQSDGTLLTGSEAYRAFWKWHGLSNLIFLTQAIIVAVILCLKLRENH